MLAIFIVHIFFGIRLALLNGQARPVRYVYEDTVQATWASRHMLLTGLVILAFVIYHLLHFTFGAVDPANYKFTLKPDDENLHDVAGMVVGGFKQWPISASYIVAMLVLGLHLWHGGGSWLQSLGLNNKRWRPYVSGLGVAVALIVVVGNCSIPLAILLGWHPS